jgi:hypothetical protein
MVFHAHRHGGVYHQSQEENSDDPKLFVAKGFVGEIAFFKMIEVSNAGMPFAFRTWLASSVVSVPFSDLNDW